MKPERPLSETDDSVVASEPAASDDASDAVARPDEDVSTASDIGEPEAALLDQLKRALAEQDNLRRNAGRDREQAVKFATSTLARDLLATLDNLRRAIESVPADRVADPAVAGLLSGVVATERGLLDTLARHGIRRFDPIGAAFDPHHHDAVFQVATSARAPGTVVEVLQPGYMHHDRLLRPATVGVAKSDARETESH